MAEEVETKAGEDEEKRTKKRQYLEASVTLGLGYGQKKKQYLKAFFGAVWPVLQTAGWTQVKGEGKDEGLTHFLPPGVMMGRECEEQEDAPRHRSPSKENAFREEGPWTCSSCGHTNSTVKSRCNGSFDDGQRCMAWRDGKRCHKPYFSRVRDVIERVLEKNNEVEAVAAEAFTELVPHVADLFGAKKDEKEMEGSAGSPSAPSSQIRQKNDLCAWKDERIHYNKSSSRVGTEFQVDTYPKAGSYAYSENHTDAEDRGALYERVWDPALADELGKLDFVHTRVQYNKRESAYELFHSRTYRLPGFYQDVKSLSPGDCSDWTKEDTNAFRAAVFEHHENMIEVSNAIGKPVSQCITYYLVRFKRTKSYKSLKRSMRRKANLSGGVADGTLVCGECSKGGMLIACDTCETHYHLSCATPPLESIPEGNWICGSCRRETRSMQSLQDEQTQGSGDASMNSGVNSADKDIKPEVIDGASVSQIGNLDEGGVALEVADDTHKRKLDSIGESTSLDVQPKRSTRYKMWRPW